MSDRIYAAGCDRIYAGAAPPRALAPFEAPEHTNGAVRLDPESVDAIARRLLELTGTEAAGLVDAAELARRMGVSRDWVYRHAEQLGAVRIGTGRRARLRFDPLVAYPENRRSEVEEVPAQPAKPRVRPRARTGTSAPLAAPVTAERSSERALPLLENHLDELSRHILSADGRLMARAMADALRKEGGDR